jgi:hypothetical protein
MGEKPQRRLRRWPQMALAVVAEVSLCGYGALEGTDGCLRLSTELDDTEIPRVDPFRGLQSPRQNLGSPRGRASHGTPRRTVSSSHENGQAGGAARSNEGGVARENELASWPRKARRGGLLPKLPWALSPRKRKVRSCMTPEILIT